MPRRKPVSGKQHKAELQLKRAIKRGDAPLPISNTSNPRRKFILTGSTSQRPKTATSNAHVDASRRLQSSFIKLPAKFLEDAKALASKLILPRPIPSQLAILYGIENAVEKHEVLSCPRRPKWKYDMSKEVVEKNEEGLFNKWLKETNEIVARWQEGQPKVTDVHTQDKEGLREENAFEMPRSPTYFERNIEVWRQFWRVAEISQILLVLIDSRSPLLHFPPSLSTYLRSRKVVLVLTKVDITGPARADAWTSYLRRKYPGIRVVQVKSYVEKVESERKQGRKIFDPHLPPTFRETLVEALKATHAEMLEPPDKLRGDEEKLKQWKPLVKREIDWEQALNARGDIVVPSGHDECEVEEGLEPDFLTIGLIGQPNVGKSSLLNALFGARKVRASRTPGKTKHFQTLFWTPQVRLVDCPGLVMPNFVPIEKQVLSGIIPIATISSIPSCIYYAALLLPLERIFNLTHPSLTSPAVIDKRTWRDGARPSSDSDSKVERSVHWTAMDILIAYAEQNRWVTAKAGRPDVMRAGNAILRALAEGRVGWGFWPEGAPVEDDGCGIWISGVSSPDQDDGESEQLESDEQTSSEQTDYDSEEAEDEENDGVVQIDGIGLGRFGALALEEDEQ